MRLSGLFLVLFLGLGYAEAGTYKPLAPSLEETAASIQWNRKLGSRNYQWDYNRSLETTPSVERPFSETEEAGFLLFHADAPFSASRIKNTLAENLPSGVKLFVYTDSPKDVPDLKRHYEALAGKSNVEIASLDYASSDRAVWARDNTPIPIKLAPQMDQSSWGAVDAVYYGGDAPDEALAQWFHIQLVKNPYQFEGGNFVADQRGNCLIVNKTATAAIPDSVFHEIYGCKKLVRLKHVAGIGHADERVKFINEKTILTDTPSYVSTLSQLGYEVVVLPKPQNGKYRTY
ncbi:MAG: hypothetical protein EB120_13275, partial [Proteobacteria bacterium]|nr:hypothetical protein [Pseudomonadota bacterium]